MQSNVPEYYLFETERLTDLTRDLLELNAFDTQELLLNRESFDIHDVIRSTAASFEGTCTQKKISIELVLATGICPYLLTNTKSSRCSTI